MQTDAYLTFSGASNRSFTFHPSQSKFFSHSNVEVLLSDSDFRERMLSVSSSSKASVVSAKRPSKRLQFDRRYGWVYDEWRDPAEEALAGGRGMFCILPIAKALIEMASQSINLATTSAVKVIERPNQFSPQVLQAGLSDRFHKFVSSVQGSNPDFFPLKGLSKTVFPLHATCTSTKQ